MALWSAVESHLSFTQAPVLPHAGALLIFSALACMDAKDTNRGKASCLQFRWREPRAGFQASICVFFRRHWLCCPYTSVSACSGGIRNAIENLGITGSSYHKPLSLRLAIIARCSLDLARLVIFMSGTTGATGGKSGNAEKHWSHRDQGHALWAQGWD
jgi:hypothetical protein